MLWSIRLVFFAFGLGYLFLVPPFQVPDEYMHFGRTLAVADGHLRAERQQARMGYRIPCSAAWLMEKMPRSVEFRTEGKYEWQSFRQLNAEAVRKPGTCFWEIDRGSLQMHVPFLYAPQVVGVWVTRLFTDEPAIWLYAARAANFLFCYFLLFGILRIDPRANLRLFALATLPMLFHLFASVSGDALVIVLSFIYYQWLLAALEIPAFSSRNYWLLAVVSILFGLAKSVYFPFLLLLGFVAQKSRNRVVYTKVALTIGIAFALVLLWNFAVRHDYYSTEIYGMDPGKQVQFMLSHPVTSALAVIRGFIDNAAKIAVTYFGVFGWLSVIMPFAWYVGYFALSVLILLITPADAPQGRVLRLSFAGAALAVMLLLSLVMYVTFTPVGFPFTKGLQGRHLMPVIPFLLAVLPGAAQLQRVRPRLILPIIGAIAFFHLLALWQIKTRFF